MSRTQLTGIKMISLLRKVPTCIFKDAVEPLKYYSPSQPHTTGAVFLSVLLSEMFWMWKETMVSTWPFNTASAALQRHEREHVHLFLAH